MSLPRHQADLGRARLGLPRGPGEGAQSGQQVGPAFGGHRRHHPCQLGAPASGDAASQLSAGRTETEDHLAAVSGFSRRVTSSEASSRSIIRTAVEAVTPSTRGEGLSRPLLPEQTPTHSVRSGRALGMAPGSAFEVLGPGLLEEQSEFTHVGLLGRAPADPR